MKQRSITELEVKSVLYNPEYVKKLTDGRKEASAKVSNRSIKIILVQIENIIKIITVM